jgi:hypothetical protein
MLGYGNTKRSGTGEDSGETSTRIPAELSFTHYMPLSHKLFWGVGAGYLGRLSNTLFSIYPSLIRHSTFLVAFHAFLECAHMLFQAQIVADY